VTATVETTDGSTITAVSWTQTGGVAASISPADGNPTTVTLGAEGLYKDELFFVLAEPPIGPEQLPPNVPLPEGEFPGGLQNRFQVVGVNPFALEEAGLVTLKVEVTTTSGTYSEEAEVHTSLPWTVTSDIRNVGIQLPVLVHGKEQKSYDWTLTLPPGSAAALKDATAQNPEFTPDVPGLYTVEVTDLSSPDMCQGDFDMDGDVDGIDLGVFGGEFGRTDCCDSGAEPCSGDFNDDCDVDGEDLSVFAGEFGRTDCPAGSPTTLEVYAGTWRGVIVGQDLDGRPVADPNCTFCHNPQGTFAPDKFTPWAQTGHAEIFTNMLNTNTHYGESCFPCHTVGFNLTVANGGFDDAPDYQDFLDSGLINNPGDNWTTMLMDYPDSAQLANIQCENCHGPQTSAAHVQRDSSLTGLDARGSISSDVCAVCHGEPLRHARFQQWQLSAHANYELAIDEGESGSCSRCHTGNGFLTWFPILNGDEPGDPLDDITVSWTTDATHPQTCVTCHDPHSIGTTTGIDTNATVRISGNTPPLIAGFTALGVGRGAMCMTCHNSRRGLRNDSTYDETVAEGDEARAPHGSAQTDMLMGQNAYFINVGIRGNHSFIVDTCANCHMVRTPPPDVLSYNLGGTNHTFFASDEICSQCHGEFTAEGVRDAFEATLEELLGMIEEAQLALIAEQTGLGRSIDVNGQRTITDPAQIQEIEFGETRGRQALGFTFTDGTVIDLTRVTDIDVIDGSGAVIGELYDFADERLIKSGWNWNLVNNDGSRGIHNPSFSLQALDAAVDALIMLAEE
jgi:hypothetical protein